MFRPLLPRCGASQASRTSRLLLGLRQNARQYSIGAGAASSTIQLDIEPKHLSITKTSKPGALHKPEDLVFGQTFTGNTSPSE